MKLKQNHYWIGIILIGIIILFLMPVKTNGQNDKWFSKKDIAPMALTLGAGYAQGWREQVIHHPNQLFKQFPNLNRNFWDIRVQGKKGFLNMQWDADHTLKATSAGLFVAAIAIKTGEKKRWYWYIWDGVKYYLSYKAGFFLAYNVTLKNKL